MSAPLEQAHPTDVPAGFAVRAPRWMPAILWTSAAINLASLLLRFQLVILFTTAALAFAALAQQSWRAEVRPDGIRFTNRIGLDWTRSWDELRPHVAVATPGRLGTLVRGRLHTGRRVAVANGRVTTLAGAQIAPETAQQLMQAWADAGTTPH